MTYETVITHTKKIESMLKENYQAKGKGLHQQTTSVETKLSALVVRGLRIIASVRNNLMHETDFTPESIPEDFEQLCIEVESILSSRNDTVQGQHRKKASSSITCHVCAAIPEQYSGIIGWCGSCRRNYEIHVDHSCIHYF